MNYRTEAYRKVNPEHTQNERARLPGVYKHLLIIAGSEEEIFDEKFVSGYLPNNHLVKVRKSALEYIVD